MNNNFNASNYARSVMETCEIQLLCEKSNKKNQSQT